MKYADDIKVQVISWLLPQLQDLEILATELPFSDGAFKADLAIVSPSRLEAIEIKGPRDDLRKLDRQLPAYQSMFLSVSVVVVDDRHVSMLRAKLDRSVGILTATPQGITKVRAPRISALLDKPAAATWMQGIDLRRALTNAGYTFPRNASVTWLRSACIDVISSRGLNDLAMGSVFSRCKKRYENFLNELGRTITLDDLRMLGLAHTISQKGA